MVGCIIGHHSIIWDESFKMINPIIIFISTVLMTWSSNYWHIMSGTNIAVVKPLA